MDPRVLVSWHPPDFGASSCSYEGENEDSKKKKEKMEEATSFWKRGRKTKTFTL
jgi:hypothetical protein